MPNTRAIVSAGLLAIALLQTPASAGAGGRATARSAPSLTEILEARTIDGLTMSPDGEKIAFRVASPSIAANRTTVTWYSAQLSRPASPTRLGREQAPIWMPLFDTIDDAHAQWAADSQWLLVLALSGDQLQVHRLGPNDRDEPLTQDRADVRGFHLSSDGQTLLYQVSNDRDAIQQAQQEESLRGIHLDQSVITEGLHLTGNYHLGDRLTTVRHGSDPVPTEAYGGSLRDKSLPLASSTHSRPTVMDAQSMRGDSEVLDLQHPVANGAALHFHTGGATIRLRLLEAADATMRTARVRIEAELPDGTIRTCAPALCTGIYPALREVLLNERTHEVVILADPALSGRLTLHAWNPGTGAVRLVWDGGGLLTTGATRGSTVCPVTDDKLVCVFSSSTQPQRLVVIDLSTGALTVLADPNAELRRAQYPPIRALAWKDAKGFSSNGVLVLPSQRTGPVPLVITTYGCAGFLQGGTAAVTPEFVLASHGIAALCVNSISDRLFELARRGSMEPLEIHKMALASYEAIVAKLADEGLVDRSKVGISGQSFSSNAAAYAISHSDLFQAASIGTGVTIDPASYYIAASPSGSWRKATFSVMGLPKPDSDPDHIWQQGSPALNAARIKAVLLIQSPENEYLFALQLYGAINDARGRTDMYVYPDAGHMLRRQPVQQLTRARRSINWFRFWLTPEDHSDFLDPDELERWRALGRAPTPSPK